MTRIQPEPKVLDIFPGESRRYEIDLSANVAEGDSIVDVVELEQVALGEVEGSGPITFGVPTMVGGRLQFRVTAGPGVLAKERYRINALVETVGEDLVAGWGYLQVLPAE